MSHNEHDRNAKRTAHRGHTFSFKPAGAYCETCDEYLSKQSNAALKEREDEA